MVSSVTYCLQPFNTMKLLRRLLLRLPIALGLGSLLRAAAAASGKSPVVHSDAREERAMMITPQEYKQCLHGFSFTDCVVRDRNRFTFIATQVLSDAEVEAEEKNMIDPSYRRKRVLPFKRDDAVGDQWGWTTLLNWDLFRGGAALLPENQFVGVDLEGRVFVTGSGVSEQEQNVPSFRQGGLNRGGIRKLKTIGGYLYACGGARSVGKRVGKNQWTSHTQTMSAHPDAGRGGFNDIDGFNENDLYAVGGKADLWHYDGLRWKQLKLPTDDWIETVCCAGDGQVYLSSSEGMILQGRGDRWKMIAHPGSTSYGFRDMVWYEDRVWVTNDDAIWTIYQNKLQRAKLPSKVAVCAGHLYVNDGVLLIAGLGGAAFKEAGEWHSIVLRAEMEQMVHNARR